MSISIGGIGAPQAMTGASRPMPPAQKMAALFDRIDTAGSGLIGKSQLELAFQTMNPPRPFQQAGVEAVWSKLDANGSGSVSKQDFVSTMTSMISTLRQQAVSASATVQAPAQTADNNRAALQALDTPGSILNKTI